MFSKKCDVELLSSKVVSVHTFIPLVSVANTTLQTIAFFYTLGEIK